MNKQKTIQELDKLITTITNLESCDESLSGAFIININNTDFNTIMKEFAISKKYELEKGV